MSTTLDKVNDNITALRKEVNELKQIIEEDRLELADDVKRQIDNSRKRPISEFRTQEYMKKKFL